jgi:hypothetical protein
MKNQYEIIDDYVVIYMKRKKSGEILKTYIDLDDFDKVKELNLSWHPYWEKTMKKYYARATRYLGIVDGKPKYDTPLLHQIIVDTVGMGGKIHVDHKNHDTLDNRKENIAVTSTSQNAMNRQGANKNGTTGVRNVSYDKTNNKYIVQLQVNGKNTVFGRFKELEDAKECAEYHRNKLYNIHQ